MGNPLAGVNVTVKDYPSIMTISGADGEYRILAFDFSKALIFSFSGMRTIESPIGKINRIEVKMAYLPFKNPNPYSIGGYLKPFSNKLNNSAVIDSEYWDLDNRFSVLAEFNINYFITQNIGVGTGAAIGVYNSNMYLKNFNNYGENYIERTDKDGDTYFLYNDANKVSENTQLTTFSLPLTFKFHAWQHKKIGLFVDLGLRFMYIVDAKLDADIYTNMYAYYPQYHVVIYDLPEYGIVNIDEKIEQKIEDYNRFNTSMIVSIGASYKLGKNVHIDFGFYYEYGFTDIGFNKPQYNADFLSTIGVVGQTSTKAVGINMGIRWDIITQK